MRYDIYCPPARIAKSPRANRTAGHIGGDTILYRLKHKYDRYIYDTAVLKKIGNRYKLSHMYLTVNYDYYRNNDSRGNVNDKKLDNNISRAKARVYELALCNDWTHFITLTIDAKKYDRYDLSAYIKDLSQFLRNQRRKYNTKIAYLLIPEQHRDGAWHMHGFIEGLTIKMLHENAHGYMDWIDYTRKFGYCSIDTIKHKEKAANYITKYISKDFSKGVTRLNAKMYYCSHGLNRAETIKKGLLIPQKISNPDYVGDYASVKWYDDVNIALSLID